jgi:uncharacterized protein with HEPN domain
MSSRNYILFLEDIVNSMEKVKTYINNLTYAEFSEKDIVIDAVVRNLEVIGEAAKNVPMKIREENKQIPWRRMIGLRNIISHEYFGIDLNIVWTIITKNLPDTRKDIEELIGKLRK